jgi:hypothetical protein
VLPMQELYVLALPAAHSIAEPREVTFARVGFTIPEACAAVWHPKVCARPASTQDVIFLTVPFLRTANHSQALKLIVCEIAQGRGVGILRAAVTSCSIIARGNSNVFGYL